jgi:MoaA/NifB/PqqE/SkfB family radical SAM enzyme
VPTTSESTANGTSLGTYPRGTRAGGASSVRSTGRLVGNGPLADRGFDAATWLALRAGRIGPLRRIIADYVERKIRARAEQPVTRHLLSVEHDVIGLGLALLAAAERALANGQLGAPALRAMLRNLYCDVLVHRSGTDTAMRFRARHGQAPPAFLVISPGKACNLRCEGCYANSGSHREKLSWPVLERLVVEAYREWGTRFFVISGGEPLAYRDQDKGVMDLAERFPDCFFVMYTNGTLIDDVVAERMGELGNVSPTLSVEGMKGPTDARRGDGVYNKVVAAMERLRRERVLYGISLTPTRKNVEGILSDEVVDFFFEKMGVLYAFVFHYMPIGRIFTLELMLTPEQRMRLYDRVWSLIRERHFPILDFWNSATGSNGCLAAGRAGGYFHVNWNGDVSPCVFVPYAPKNIHEIFDNGGTLDTLWADPFFADIRQWQRRYGYREDHEHCNGACGNWMAPCLIRDHHADFMKIMGDHPHVRPVDDDARAALEDPAYHVGLERFDGDYEALAGPKWRDQYLHGPGVSPGRMRRE